MKFIKHLLIININFDCSCLVLTELSFATHLTRKYSPMGTFRATDPRASLIRHLAPAGISNSPPRTLSNCHKSAGGTLAHSEAKVWPTCRMIYIFVFFRFHFPFFYIISKSFSFIFGIF